MKWKMTKTPDSSTTAQTKQAKSESKLFSPVAESIMKFRRWWRVSVRSGVGQKAVIAKVKEDSGFTPRFAFMTCMSAGIAILGLLLSSPAVVIGAMLLSPLMGPIMGIGFALAIGDYGWLKDSAKAIVIGTLVAVLFAGLVVTLSPLQTVTTEIASRTRPNLFDLAVALFSALAGAYAMIRGRAHTIVGVAIATALMPPLAVVGFGLATFNMSVFGGSLLLFFTNLMTIALTVAGMARLYGFRSNLSERQSQMQVAAMFVIFIGLAVPLGIALQQIASEANISRQANKFVKNQFGNKARVSQIDIDFDANPIMISASVFTPTIITDAEEQAARMLSRTFDKAIAVKIAQYRVEIGGNAAKAELNAARLKEQARLVEIGVVQLRNNLAMVAGVSTDEVIIDPSKRRAIVLTKPLPGASLATYFALEQRVAGQAADWSIEIQPPTDTLPPDIVLVDGKLDEQTMVEIDLIAWASKRVKLPLGVSGREADVAEVIQILDSKDITATKNDNTVLESGSVQFRWLVP